MKIFISIIYIVFFSFITSYSFANDKHAFHLKIIANDNSISYLDYDTKKSKLSLEIQTDLLIFINVNERRSDIIDDILNNNED